MPAISDLSLGMSIQVRVEKKQVSGWIRFLGTTKFAEGDWVGVELEEPRGKNDGSVKDQRYFTCEEAHGLFVRPANVDVKRKARKTAQAQQDMKNLKRTTKMPSFGCSPKHRHRVCRRKSWS